jgi:hypothetical protein
MRTVVTFKSDLVSELSQRFGDNAFGRQLIDLSNELFVLVRLLVQTASRIPCFSSSQFSSGSD